MNSLEADYANEGKGEIFEALRDQLTGELRDVTYEEIGDRLGISKDNVGVILHRMRARYAKTIRDEIAQSLADTGDVGEELSYLQEILRDY